MRILLRAVALAFTLGAIGPADAAAPLERQVEGVVLAALPPSGRPLDVPIAPPEEGLDRIEAALRALLGASPFAKARVGELTAAGLVVILYAPDFPPHAANSDGTGLAAFIPDLPLKYEGRRFPTVVGRYGVRWPLDELAAILAHELLGHGRQHLDGRLERMDVRDAECEAHLYQELAYQALGVPKSTNVMISFRNQMEEMFCRPFKQHLFQTDRAKLALWEQRDPDALALLGLFSAYVRARY